MAKANGNHGRCDCNRCQAHDRGIRGPFTPTELVRHFTVTSSAEPESSAMPTDTAEAALELEAAYERREQAKEDFGEVRQRLYERHASRSSRRAVKKAQEAVDGAEELWRQASEDELAARQRFHQLRQRDAAHTRQAEQQRQAEREQAKRDAAERQKAEAADRARELIKQTRSDG